MKTTRLKSWEELLGCPTSECSCGSCSDHVHPRRGGNAGKDDSQCEPWRRTSSLARSHAMVLSPDQWWKQAASMARLISPKRTKIVNELQVAVMQWELTLVEHESKLSEVAADSMKTGIESHASQRHTPTIPRWTSP